MQSRFSSAGMGGQRGHGAACDPRTHAVGAAGQNDWHSCAEHDAGAVGVGQKAELLGEDIPCFQVGRQKYVRSPATSE